MLQQQLPYAVLFVLRAPFDPHESGIQRSIFQVLLKNVREAAGHTRPEIDTGRAKYDDNAAGHIFAAMIAYAFHYRRGSAIAHRETFPSPSCDVKLSRSCAVEDGISVNHVAPDRSSTSRRDCDRASAEPFAYIIIRLSREL